VNNSVVVVILCLASALWACGVEDQPAQAMEKPDLPRNVALGELLTPGPLGDEAMGNPSAPVTVIEYSSMTCPHCADFHVGIFPEIKTRYIVTGRVRYIFREFPLDALAASASVLARCAGPNYFPVIETLFAQQKDWMVQQPLPQLIAIVQRVGVSKQQLDECLANQRLLDAIQETRVRAKEKFNVDATPTFFVNGRMFRGAVTIEEVEGVLKAFPADANTAPAAPWAPAPRAQKKKP
jgi:protein-disulfide isomerase